jgi:hypothetical protein
LIPLDLGGSIPHSPGGLKEYTCFCLTNRKTGNGMNYHAHSKRLSCGIHTKFKVIFSLASAKQMGCGSFQHLEICDFF